MISFTPIDEKVYTTQEMRIMFMHFFIGNHFGVVDAAVQGNVDCEDYVSHWIVLPPFYVLVLVRV